MTSASPLTLLLVDDDDRFRERLGRAITDRGYQVLMARQHSEAASLAARHPIDRAVVDLRMPGPNGLAVIEMLRQLHPAAEIVVLTGYGSIATAVDAMRLGARDYLTKPCDADRVLAAFAGEPEPTEDAPSKDEGSKDELPFEVPSLARLEREHIERVLSDCNGNVSKAARVLGLHRRTLQYKLAKFSVER